MSHSTQYSQVKPDNSIAWATLICVLTYYFGVGIVREPKDQINCHELVFRVPLATASYLHLTVLQFPYSFLTAVTLTGVLLA